MSWSNFGNRTCSTVSKKEKKDTDTLSFPRYRHFSILINLWESIAWLAQ